MEIWKILIDGWMKEVSTGSWLVSWHTKIGRHQLCAGGDFCISTNSLFWKYSLEFWKYSLELYLCKLRPLFWYSYINNVVLRILYVQNTIQPTRACSTCTQLPISFSLLLPRRLSCRAMQGSPRQPGTWRYIIAFSPSITVGCSEISIHPIQSIRNI